MRIVARIPLPFDETIWNVPPSELMREAMFDSAAGCVFQRVVYQLADDAIENHLDIRVVAFRVQVGRKADFHIVDSGAFVDEVLHAAHQSEIVQHVGRQIVRYFAQRADGFVDDRGRVVDDFALFVVAFVAG